MCLNERYIKKALDNGNYCMNIQYKLLQEKITKTIESIDEFRCIDASMHRCINIDALVDES